MLLLDREGINLALRLSSANDEDLERIGQVPVKKMVMAEHNGRQVYDFWSVPYSDLSLIYEIWPEKQRLSSPAVKELYQRYLDELKPLDALDPFDLSVVQHFTPYRPPLPHQAYIFKAAERYRTLDASDCGLGKGYASLYRARLFYEKDRADLRPEKLLIVSINSQVEGPDSWATEVVNMYGVTPAIWLGTKKQRLKLIDEVEKAEVVIATYDLAHELNFMSFDSYIFDEADMFSNRETDTYKRMEPLFEDSFQMIDMQEWDNGFVEKPMQALTGTPVGKHISTSWSILHLVSPLRWGTYDAFCLKHEHRDKVVANWKPEKRLDGTVKFNRVVEATKTTAINMESFKEKLDATAFRVTRDKNVSFKEGVICKDFDLTPDQQELYDEVTSDILTSLETADSTVSWASTLNQSRVKFLRLLQISEGLFNIPGYENNLESAKLDYLIDTLSQADHKIIVWSRFRRIIDLLYLLFEDKAVAWHGDVDKKSKILAKGAFHAPTGEALRQYLALAREKRFRFAPGGAQFFLAVTERRSSRGMNLHGSCYHQIFPSLPLHAPTLIQTIGRVVRVGQERDTITEFLRSRGTWEIQLLKYMLNQIRFSKTILDGKEMANKSELIVFMDMLRNESSDKPRTNSRWDVRPH